LLVRVLMVGKKKRLLFCLPSTSAPTSNPTHTLQQRERATVWPRGRMHTASYRLNSCPC
jgi:hypothetical protein